MNWRLEVNHVTQYRYDRPVVASYNEARVTPLTTPGQIVIDARLSVSPAAEMFTYWDYWGAQVHAFDVHAPHETLVVTAKALVETGVQLPSGSAFEKAGPQEAGTGVAGTELTWGQLADGGTVDDFYEFLAPSPLVVPDDFREVAARLRGDSAGPFEAVAEVMNWAHGELEYGGGATHVGSSAREAWEAGRGVCQDFSHLSLGVLRSMGIPARYVSGYFYSKEDGQVGATVRGESHAWVEAWTGSWTGWDPTNLVDVAHRHVLVARGRDYSDVAPLKGIYSGPPGSSADVAVELTRRA